MTLISRRINIQDPSCPICDTGQESSLHLFTGCAFSCGVWMSIGKWCNLAPVWLFDFEDILKLHLAVSGSKWSKRIVKGIVIITCWEIRKARNDNVFNGVNQNVVEVVARVKACSFLWLKNRTSFNDIVWKCWVINPL